MLKSRRTIPTLFSNGLYRSFKVSVLLSTLLFSGTLIAQTQLPSAVRNISETAVSPSMIELSWMVPVSDGGSPILIYRITRDGGLDETLASVLNTGASSITHRITGLSAAQSQRYIIYAVNAAGQGPGTISAIIATLTATAPGVPTSLLFSPSTETSLILTWRVPLETGGTPITNYRIERREVADLAAASTSITIPAPPDPAQQILSYNDRTVMADQDYYYRVIAINNEGDGMPSEVGFFRLPEAVNRPVSSFAGRLNAQTPQDTIDLSWQAPRTVPRILPGGIEIAGGVPVFVLGYRIIWFTAADNTVNTIDLDLSDFGDSANPSYTHTGLIPGETYTYNIQALNANLGPMLPDNERVSLRTAVAELFEPEGLTATALNSSSIALSWDAPENAELVTGYEIERFRVAAEALVTDSQVTIPVPADARNYIDLALQAETIYRYRIRAINIGGGYTNFSDPERATTLAGGGFAHRTKKSICNNRCNEHG